MTKPTEPTVTPCGEHFGRVHYRGTVWNVCTCSMSDAQLAEFLSRCKREADDKRSSAGTV